MYVVKILNIGADPFLNERHKKWISQQRKTEGGSKKFDATIPSDFDQMVERMTSMGRREYGMTEKQLQNFLIKIGNARKKRIQVKNKARDEAI